jgi:hypothetical protein
MELRNVLCFDGHSFINPLIKIYFLNRRLCEEQLNGLIPKNATLRG